MLLIQNVYQDYALIIIVKAIKRVHLAIQLINVMCIIIVKKKFVKNN